MTTRLTGAIAAGSLAIGLGLGAASDIVARDDAASDIADHRSHHAPPSPAATR